MYTWRLETAGQKIVLHILFKFRYMWHIDCVCCYFDSKSDGNSLGERFRDKAILIASIGGFFK